MGGWSAGRTGGRQCAKGKKEGKKERNHISSKRVAKQRRTMVKLQVAEMLNDPDNPVGYAVATLKDFINNSIRLVRKCTKPDAREFRKIAVACSLGFFVMGAIGYFVKLIFIPINNILVGG